MPHIQTLSDIKRKEVYNRAWQLQNQQALAEHLKAMTPPVDEKEAVEEDQRNEIQARKELENDGCPPCYPPSMQVPLQEVPEEYQGAVEHWRTYTQWGEIVLPQQLADWRRFRSYQQYVRSYYGEKKFHRYVDRIREVRKSHSLPSDISLFWDPAQQDRLQNWVEFQSWRVRIHDEELECKLQEMQRRVDQAQETAVDMGSNLLLGELSYAKRRVAHHAGLLRWVESQRQVMVAAETLRSNACTKTSEASQYFELMDSLSGAVRRRVQRTGTNRVLRRGCRAAHATCEHRKQHSRPKTKTSKEQADLVATECALKTRSGRISKPPLRWSS
ncbi:hypothetical protein M433DRAFT_7454 [Acidomyces richmondensis BFW]|nr:hypothetical protein M433DRAFT_7454 [Acidomyces richmondensis BFW]